MKRSRIQLKPRTRQKFSQKQIAIVASSIVACLSIGLIVFFNTTSNPEAKAETPVESSGMELSDEHSSSAAEMENFDAITEGQAVSFFWSSERESEKDSFIVERSADGKQFSAVTKVKSEGKSKTKRSYSASDQSPFSGITYYRVKQINHQGMVTYSALKTVKNNNTEDSRFSLNIDEVYPNRFENHFVLQYSAKKTAAVTFKILNLSGQVLYRETLKSSRGGNEYIFDGGDKLRTGAYIATLSCGNDQVSANIIKN